MTDDIDDMVRAAASAHQGLVGADYFDALPARVLERLDRDERLASVVSNEVAMMSDTTSKDSPRGASPPAPTGGAVPERTDDSGLHDMKALAQTAKQRISRRVTSQHDAYDESLLSSSQSGLRAVALPAPAQLVSLPELPGQAAAVADGGAAVTPISAASDIRTAKKSKTAMWVIGGGLLAAAAAAAFIVGTGTKKDKQDDATAAAQVARADDGTAAATGAPGGDMGSMAAPTAGAMPAPKTEVTSLDPATAPEATAPALAVADGKDKNDRAAGSGSAPREEREQKPKAGESKVGAGGTATPPADKGVRKLEKATGDKVAPGDKAPGGATAGGDKSIEDLLSEASGGAQKPSDSGGGGGEVKPEKTGLDGKDIRSGMSAVAGKAQGCYDQHGVAGHVKVKAVVDPSGKVTKADATGEFAGTPTGSCVAGVVKGASFATWTGAPMTISYGFTLQE